MQADIIAVVSDRVAAASSQQRSLRRVRQMVSITHTQNDQQPRPEQDAVGGDTQAFSRICP
jgi:hypothetical protein